MHQWERRKWHPSRPNVVIILCPPPKADDVAVGKANRRVLKESIQAMEGFRSWKTWIFSFVLRVETPPIMKVKAIDKGIWHMVYEGDSESYNDSPLHHQLGIRKLFPVTLWYLTLCLLQISRNVKREQFPEKKSSRPRLVLEKQDCHFLVSRFDCR